jgi:DNA (cytosine-5)-methyltransferase 1
MKKLKLKQSKEKIIKFIKQNFPDFYSHEEFDAALTHWMHHPSQCPPIMPEELFLKLPTLFIKLPPSDIIKYTSSEGHDIYQSYFQFVIDNIPFPTPKNPKFKFIDLFAGIGGIRLAFQEAGGECVFSSEWDKNAQRTYLENYGEIPYGDITKIDKSQVPKHDILLGGFPCQAFSIAGYRKGFDDDKGRGNLFFDIEELILNKQPDAFLLENVKNLQGHDSGNTFRVITEKLHSAGYSVLSNVLNTMDYGNIPQNRERIYIVGFKGEANWQDIKQDTCSSKFNWPEPVELKTTVRDLLEKKVDEKYFYEQYKCYKELKPVVSNK